MSAPTSEPNPNRWWTLAAVVVATFMLLLDITIVNVALPAIQKDFHAGLADLQWVVDAYALSLAALQLTAGSIADLRGRKLVFVTGLGLFTAASFLCGLADSPTFLNVARGLQGIGGAMMFATSLALLANAFVGRERGVAFGVWGATIGASVAIGPLVGGAITDGLGWEWIFFVNVPIGIAAIVFTQRKVDESRNPYARSIDWPGVVVWSAGLFLLVLGLIRGNEQGWGSARTVGELGVAVALIVAFLVIESRRKEPMLDLSLFRNPAFAGVSVVAFVLSAAMFSMFLYLTLYIQNGLGYTPFETGLRFLPLTVISFFAAAAAGRPTHAVAPRVLFGVGLGLVGLGLLLMHGIEPSSGWTTLLAGFIAAGAGVGLCNPVIAQVAVGVVEPARSGMAAGINNTFRQVGVSTGIAGWGAIFQARVESKATSLLTATGVPGGRAEAVAHSLATQQGGGGPRGGAIARVAQVSFISALNDILMVAAIVAFAGAVAGLLLVRSDAFAHGAEAEAAPAAA
ncbi:MAG TPA: MFS transporter [Thermoleophilaceae bacterium]